jgi:hypothetical protein
MSIRAIIIAAVLASSLSCQRRMVPVIQTTDQVASRVMQQILGGKDDTLLNEFHYPPGESRDRRAEDRRGVAKLLTIMRNDFGEVLSAHRQPAWPNSYRVSVGAGSVTYWADHPRFQTYTYAVRFSKRGQGWTIIDICTIDSTPQLRMVSFALPMDRAGSLTEIESTSKKMFAAIRADDETLGRGMPNGSQRGTGSSVER